MTLVVTNESGLYADTRGFTGIDTLNPVPVYMNKIFCSKKSSCAFGVSGPYRVSEEGYDMFANALMEYSLFKHISSNEFVDKYKLRGKILNLFSALQEYMEMYLLSLMESAKISQALVITPYHNIVCLKEADKITIKEPSYFSAIGSGSRIAVLANEFGHDIRSVYIKVASIDKLIDCERVLTIQRKDLVKVLPIETMVKYTSLTKRGNELDHEQLSLLLSFSMVLNSSEVSNSDYTENQLGNLCKGIEKFLLIMLAKTKEQHLDFLRDLK